MLAAATVFTNATLSGPEAAAPSVYSISGLLALSELFPNQQVCRIPDHGSPVCSPYQGFNPGKGKIRTDHYGSNHGLNEWKGVCSNVGFQAGPESA